MEDFDIYDDTTPDKPLIIDYQSRLRLDKLKEVPSNELIEVDPIKLSTAWIKAANRSKDSASFMSYINEIIKNYERSFTGYIPGQLPSYMLKKSFRTNHPSGKVFSKLSKRYPIQPDTDSKD
jgi:hypothetical protein